MLNCQISHVEHPHKADNRLGHPPISLCLFTLLPFEKHKQSIDKNVILYYIVLHENCNPHNSIR